MLNQSLRDSYHPGAKTRNSSLARVSLQGAHGTPTSVLGAPQAGVKSLVQNNSGLSQGRRGSRAGTLGSVSGDPPAETKAKRREIMMHPHLPGPRPLAVPGIGFPQNISVGPEVLDPVAFGDLPPLTRPTERIVWIPSPQPWFGFRS
jgi:hypothetical protein